MATQLEIINYALRLLGKRRLEDLSGTDNVTLDSLDAYNDSLDYLLDIYPWSFAKVNKLLAIEDVPADEQIDYIYKYELPADFFKIYQVGALQDHRCEWEIKRNYLYTNMEEVRIVYIAEITDTTLFTKSFTNALVHRIAYNLTFAFTSSNASRESMRALAEEAFDRAIDSDGKATGSYDPDYVVQDDDLYNAHLGGYPYGGTCGGGPSTSGSTGYTFASEAEAIAGTEDAKWMSPLRSREAFLSQIATQSEAEGDTNNTHWMSPLRVFQRLKKTFSMESGERINTPEIRAVDGNGLRLGDDDGNGPVVFDGGILSNAYQTAFRAFVATQQDNVTGDGTQYNVTGAFWTPIINVGSAFSNGTFTAPITSNKYYLNASFFMKSINAAVHDDVRMSIVVDSVEYRLGTYNGASATVGGNMIVSCTIDNISMSAGDTAYLMISADNGTKVVDLGNTFTTFSGGILV